ncbi:MAG: hypothetical protein BIP78_1567 [Candidatus Bipolaricaulis sibiricus]|uniref:UPF0102 protein BIP78_1567 n=1 Tax=Bipolaricaulis sibiricus TaxID=2501609 RepID=A0A410FWD6_BIPS1|nr:MAG: hypothetical protein BIP78_1567 [Candidatus Bipolaricaulis sibiricus]
MDGQEAEDIACRHLQAKGMRVVARNWRWRGGEVDIIARDGPTLVFVEVRFRADETHGAPEETVTPAKRDRLWRTALAFLRGVDEIPVRFDVVSVGPRGLRHICDAFREEDVRPGA